MTPDMRAIMSQRLDKDWEIEKLADHQWWGAYMPTLALPTLARLAGVPTCQHRNEVGNRCWHTLFSIETASAGLPLPCRRPSHLPNTLCSPNTDLHDIDALEVGDERLEDDEG